MNNQTSPSTPSERIRTLNDEFRRTFKGGSVMITSGIAALGKERQLEVLKAVATFDAFDAGNDPHGEHDFGSIEIRGELILFKIDYYDTDRVMHSPDPADAAVTARVLTIMLASEY
jgi:hypothetical protein